MSQRFDGVLQSPGSRPAHQRAWQESLEGFPQRPAGDPAGM